MAEPREMDPELLRLLEVAKAYKMSPAERRAQRLSFIAGQTGLSRERILEVLPELGEPEPPADG